MSASSLRRMIDTQVAHNRLRQLLHTFSHRPPNIGRALTLSPTAARSSSTKMGDTTFDYSKLSNEHGSPTLDTSKQHPASLTTPHNLTTQVIYGPPPDPQYAQYNKEHQKESLQSAINDSVRLDRDKISATDLYKLMIGAIVPRPIAWVSSISKDGKVNLAPYSFFQGLVSGFLMVSSVRSQGKYKDSATNIIETKEFVVNTVSESNAEQMNATATMQKVNELEMAELTAVPSTHVKCPRVAESMVSFECVLHQVVPIGDESKEPTADLIIGRILCVHVHNSVYLGDCKIDPAKFRPIGRLAGNSYARVATSNNCFELKRPA